MRFTLLFFIILPGTMSVYGQNPPEAQYFSDKSGALGLNGPVGVFDDHKSIQGTPYLFEEWYDGEITYMNDKNLPVEKLRYDIYKDELLVFRNKSEMGMLSKNLIKGFKLNHPKESHPLSYVKAGQISALHQVPAEQFLQVLYESENTSLYARNWKTFQKADQRATYYTEKITDEFSDVKQDLFLVKSDGSVHEIKLRRGAILNTFSDQKATLKNYIKENQLQFENTNDLVEVIKYYEQIGL